MIWTCNQLPHSPDRFGMVMLKLKRKLQFRGHVYFQAVQRELIQQLLNWFKVHNPVVNAQVKHSIRSLSECSLSV